MALKVAREHAEPATPMIVLETALPAKFNATVREAIGRDAPRPARLAGLEACRAASRPWPTTRRCSSR